MIKFLLLFYSFTTLSICFSAYGKVHEMSKVDFSKAKSILKKAYPRKGLTFYCDCPYQKKSIKTDKCKIQTKKYKKRKKRVEWEHIVPAHAFGQSFKEWREARSICKGKKKKSSRKCARAKNKLFKEMEGNIYNLVPSVGAVNAVRSNFSFAEFEKGDILCGTEMKVLNRKVSPPKNKRGDIARIYFYMNDKYPGRGIISRKNQKLFTKWNLEDPVDQNECRINEIKAQIVNEKNKFVSPFCKETK